LKKPEKFEPDIICFTATLEWFQPLEFAARLGKAVSPTMFGGVHATVALKA
jgi:hypothetical protein